MLCKRSFGMGVVLLSLVNILLRMIGVSFQAYISRRIGAESMGLLTLIMSVYGFAVTIALSGVQFAAVRLTADRCARITGGGETVCRKTVSGVVRAVSMYSLIFGTISAAGLLFLAVPIARYLLRDMRTVTALRILACTLPAVAFSSALSGCFTGLRKNGKNACISLAGQGVRILVTVTALGVTVRSLRTGEQLVERFCLAVIVGNAAADIASLLLGWILYCVDSKIPRDGNKERMREVAPYPTKFRDAASIALPTAVGSYARQGLTTAEHLAIPHGLAKSGMSASGALAAYGVLQGMALPVVLFPYAVIGAFTGMLVPEITALDTAAENDASAKIRLQRIVARILRIAGIFSACSLIVFFVGADFLGKGIYHNETSGLYIRMLAPLVPFMYMDTVVDAILKGMGEQVYCMKVNILDAGISLILVIFLTPVMGNQGYILSLYVCEIINLACSAWKLWEKMKI